MLKLLSEIFNYDPSQIKSIGFLVSLGMYRNIELFQIGMTKVVVKHFKRLQSLRLLISYLMYYGISLFTFSNPARIRIIKKSFLNRNEGKKSRNSLGKIGIKSPKLFYVDPQFLIEEFIEGENAYDWLKRSNEDACQNICYKIGCLIGQLQNSSFAFLDNKAQNYIISNNEIYRVDIGSIVKKPNEFQKSMGIGTFLGSLLDLKQLKFQSIERGFYSGYQKITGKEMSLKTVCIRNLIFLITAFATSIYSTIYKPYFSSINCIKCGVQNPSTSRLCLNCGENLKTKIKIN